VRIAHFGDLGCELEEDQIQELKDIDVCLIPVGGHYTIDGKQAAELVHKIQPRIVIPMHYRDDKAGFGFDVISTVEDFAECMDSVTRLDQSSITLDDLPDAQVVILSPRDAE
jgi:L-ascorbate metabolism protein UlaG (beta-lactamase superfamily)